MRLTTTCYSNLFWLTCAAFAAAMTPGASVAQTAEQAEAEGPSKLRVLVIDGQNNHKWQSTTPVLTQILNRSGRFVAEVATSPAKGQDLSGFRPKFSAYDAVLSNYNGARWSKETEADFLDYLSGGGGFVCVHAANNSFSDWPEYNEVIGLGGWGGRNQTSGPYVYIKDDKLVRDNSPGRGGNHGPQHEYQLQTRESDHPIMRGLPEVWKHTRDELYDQMRGPAKNMTILATAYASPDKRGTGRHEPLLMTLTYGKGRVFHTMLGHADYSMQCVGFETTLLRGTEWAATGKVTIPVPENFPTADMVSIPD